MPRRADPRQILTAWAQVVASLMATTQALAHMAIRTYASLKIRPYTMSRILPIEIFAEFKDFFIAKTKGGLITSSGPVVDKKNLTEYPEDPETCKHRAGLRPYVAAYQTRNQRRPYRICESCGSRWVCPDTSTGVWLKLPPKIRPGGPNKTEAPAPKPKSEPSPRPSSRSSARRPPSSVPKPSQPVRAASSWMQPGGYAVHLPANDPHSIEDELMDQLGEISENSDFERLQDEPLPDPP